MAFENYFGLIGLITICITSGIIAFHLLRKYYLEKNKYSLYMASFFLVDCIGWFIWIYTTIRYMDQLFFALDSTYNFYLIISNIPVIVAQLILLLFAFSVFEVHKIIRIFSVIAVVGIALFFIIYPELLWLVNVTGMIVMVLNIILFFMNWQKNEDIKSLGFSIGLIIIAIGTFVALLSLILQGIFLVMAATIWLITFSGLLERLQTER